MWKAKPKALWLNEASYERNELTQYTCLIWSIEECEEMARYYIGGWDVIFQCNNGMCIDNYYLNDGLADCYDKSDEQ